MESSTLETQKDSEAYTLLQTLQTKHSPGSTTFYFRRSDYADKRFLELDLEKIRFLQNQGVLNMSEYVRQGDRGSECHAVGFVSERQRDSQVKNDNYENRNHSPRDH